MYEQYYFFTAVRFLIFLFLIDYLPILIGQLYGKYRSKKSSDLQQGHVGAAIATEFGLLGYMLALTLQIHTRILNPGYPCQNLN